MIRLTASLRITLAHCLLADNGWEDSFVDYLLERLYRIPLGSPLEKYDGHMDDATDIQLVWLGVDNFDLNVEDYQ